MNISKSLQSYVTNTDLERLGMLNIVTISELKSEAKKYLDELDNGTPLFVTRGAKKYQVVIHKP